MKFSLRDAGGFIFLGPRCGSLLNDYLKLRLLVLSLANYKFKNELKIHVHSNK